MPGNFPQGGINEGESLRGGNVSRINGRGRLKTRSCRNYWKTKGGLDMMSQAMDKRDE